MQSYSYVINTPDVVAEVIEGELVAIQLLTGCYYHANTTGGVIWNLLEGGATSDEIVQVFQKEYGVTSQAAQSAVAGFIEKLLTESLIRVSDTPVPRKQLEMSLNAAAYTEPSLKKHEDMKELLLLDPIHDVGEATWPMQPV